MGAFGRTAAVVVPVGIRRVLLFRSADWLLLSGLLARCLQIATTVRAGNPGRVNLFVAGMTGEIFNHFRTAIGAKFKVPLQSFLAIWTLHVVASSYQKL
ncbi:MAG: hypothetical protein JL56_16120 [Desulfotomaculum sp. BICA1-6]|nr:MAG: hypothetical protein VR67_04875 [Peptococcaceae bacterium BRH_c8a]KJS70893.1 MAG: hypothetical protein JL56_16120 [Desulfotomaculum sp. BICA1-6]